MIILPHSSIDISKKINARKLDRKQDAEKFILLAVSKEKVKLGMFAKTPVSADVESENGAVATHISKLL